MNDIELGQQFIKQAESLTEDKELFKELCPNYQFAINILLEYLNGVPLLNITEDKIASFETDLKESLIGVDGEDKVQMYFSILYIVHQFIDYIINLGIIPKTRFKLGWHQYLDSLGRRHDL